MSHQQQRSNQFPPPAQEQRTAPRFHPQVGHRVASGFNHQHYGGEGHGDWDIASLQDVLLALDSALDAPNTAAQPPEATLRLQQSHASMLPSTPSSSSSSSHPANANNEVATATGVDSFVSTDSSTLIPKADYAVDHLQLSLLNPLVRGPDVLQANLLPMTTMTEFKKKYYRFDNKMIQCFPTCSRFPDVREARMLGHDHRIGRAQAWCSNPIHSIVTVPRNISLESLHVIGRFLCATPDVAVLPESDAGLLMVGDRAERLPLANCTPGRVLSVEESQLCNKVTLELLPGEAWFFNLTLPRHRRNAACAAHKVPLFVFEVLLFQESKGAFQVCSRSVSAPFEVASIRTLIREVLAFRQQGSVNGVVMGGEDGDEQEEDEDEYSTTTTSRGMATRGAAAKLSTTSSSSSSRPQRKHTRTGYSSAVQRIRLAADAMHAKKKVEVVVVPEPSASSSATSAVGSTDASAGRMESAALGSVSPSVVPQAPPPQMMMMYPPAPMPTMMNRHLSPGSTLPPITSWMDDVFDLPPVDMHQVMMIDGTTTTTTTNPPYTQSFGSVQPSPSTLQPPLFLSPPTDGFSFGSNNNHHDDDDDDLIP